MVDEETTHVGENSAGGEISLEAEDHSQSTWTATEEGTLPVKENHTKEEVSSLPEDPNSLDPSFQMKETDQAIDDLLAKFGDNFSSL